MSTQLQRTWDGLPIAPDEPHGAAIIVRRPGGPGGEREYLVLHRAHRGQDYEGDWAWTPPSGSRQPGESVLPAALRELAEESGIQARVTDLRALDLSGAWACFGLDVAAQTPVRIDAEHDRFEWLPASRALVYCKPDLSAAGIAKAEDAVTAAISFRSLSMDDLPDLVAWQHAPHAAPWFPEALDLPAAERKYRPRIEGLSPTKVHVALVDGRPCGFLQHYRVADYPPYAAATGRPEAVAIDYAIGVEALTGHGLGPQLIWGYLRDIVRPAYTAARLAVASPDVANTRSIRALEKAGFVQAGQIQTGGPREMLCELDLVKFLG